MQNALGLSFQHYRGKDELMEWLNTLPILSKEPIFARSHDTTGNQPPRTNGFITVIAIVFSKEFRGPYTMIKLLFTLIKKDIQWGKRNRINQKSRQS